MLVAHYPLNGTLRDNGPFRVNLEPKAGTATFNDLDSGMYQSVLDCKKEYYQTIGYIPALRNTRTFSFTCWVKVTVDTLGFGSILDFNCTSTRGAGSPKSITLEKTLVDKLCVFSNGLYLDDSGTGSFDITKDEWVHVSFSLDKGNIMKFYKNGELINTRTTTGSKPALTGIVSIGTTYLTNYKESVMLSNIKIYDHVISQREVYADYKAPILHYTFGHIQTFNIDKMIRDNSGMNYDIYTRGKGLSKQNDEPTMNQDAELFNQYAIFNANQSAEYYREGSISRYVDAVTFSCWVKGSPASQYIPLFGALRGGSGGMHGVGFNTAPSTGVRFLAGYGSNGIEMGIDDVPRSGWHLYTGVADKTKMQFYIDGELYREKVHDIDMRISTRWWDKYSQASESELKVVGVVPQLGQGAIADARIYPLALNQDDIRRIYSERAAVDEIGILHTGEVVETKKECSIFKGLDTNTKTSNKFSNVQWNVIKTHNYIRWEASADQSNTTLDGPYVQKDNWDEDIQANTYYHVSCNVKVTVHNLDVLRNCIIGLESVGLQTGQDLSSKNNKWFKWEVDVKSSGNPVYTAFLPCRAIGWKKGDSIEMSDLEIYKLSNNQQPQVYKNYHFNTHKLLETVDISDLNNGGTLSGTFFMVKDDALWMRIFYQRYEKDYTGTDGLFQSKNEAEDYFGSNKTNPYKWSILSAMHMENYRSLEDNKLEFLMWYPQAGANKFNHWRQQSNPLSNNTVIGYEPMTINIPYVGSGSSTNDPFVGLKYSDRSECLLNGCGIVGNWWFAIGTNTDYAGRMPLFDNSNLNTYVELYIRVDKPMTGVYEMVKYGYGLRGADGNQSEPFRIYKRLTKTTQVREI